MAIADQMCGTDREPSENETQSADQLQTRSPPSFTAMMEQRRLEAKAKAPRGIVYFVLGDDPDAVKIGFTTDLSARLQGLQTGFCRDIFLTGCFEGTVYDERDLHERFARYRIRGEWFEIRGPVLKKIDSLRRNKKCCDMLLKYQPWQNADDPRWRGAA